MSVQTQQNLVNDQGVFSSSKHYSVQQIPSIAGPLVYFCPTVTFNGTRYIAENILVQPTLGSNPNVDAAWSIFNESSVPNVAPVLVASTANLTLSGEQTIDGRLTSTSRILVKNQTLSQNNGLYVTASGAWSRSTDANTQAKLIGLVVEIEDGDTQAGFIYASGAAIGGTLGTTPLPFTLVGKDQTITATAPLSIDNNVISISSTPTFSTVTSALVGNATTATTATNIAGGTAGQVPVQTGAGATVLITKANGFVMGFNGSGISAAAITLNNGTSVVTSNLTVNSTDISVPLASSLVVTAVLDITTSSASGATFTLTGTGCTCTTQAIAVGASAAQYITLCGYVTTTTGTPTISIVASALSGTVNVVSDSFLQISQS